MPIEQSSSDGIAESGFGSNPLQMIEVTHETDS